MAAGSNSPERAQDHNFEYDSDIKQSLLKQASELIHERKKDEDELARTKAALEAQHFDSTNNPDCKRLADRIVALNTQIDALADRWVNEAHGNRSRFYTRADNYHDEQYVHVEDGSDDLNVFDKKEGGKEPKKNKGEVLAATKVELAELTAEQLDERMSALIDTDGGTGAINALLDQEPPLMPMDLVEGSRQAQAIEAVFAPDPILVAYLHQTVGNPNSPYHELVMIKLRGKVASLDAHYKVEREGKKVAELGEKGTTKGEVLDKVKDYAKDFLHSPDAWLGLGMSILGYFVYSKSSGTLGKTIGGILGGGGAFMLGNHAYKSFSPAHLSVMERLGWQSSDLVSPEIIQDYKEKMVNFPLEDQDSIQFFCALQDADMSVVHEAFDRAYRGDHKMDARVFAANGLISPSVAERMNAKEESSGSLYKAFEYFFGTLSYNRALVEGYTAEMEPDKRIHIGMDFSQKTFTGKHLRNAVYYLSPAHAEAERRGVALTSSVGGGVVGAGAFESSVTGSKELPEGPINKLALENAEFHEALRYDHGDVYLVRGYPYHVNGNNGLFTFAPALAGGSLTAEHILHEGPETASGLKAILAEATDAAQKAIEAKYNTPLNPEYAKWIRYHPGATVTYNPDGSWSFNPPMDLDTLDPKSSTHKGFPHLEKGKELPVYFTFVGGRLTLHVHSQDAVLEKKEQSTLGDAKTDYEKKTVLHDVVKRDADHLLKGVDFEVTKVEDPAASPGATVITITYKDGQTGTLTYKNDTIVTIALAATPGVDLDAAWDTRAQADVEAFFSRASVQGALQQITSAYNTTHPGWMGTPERLMHWITSNVSHLWTDEAEEGFNKEFVKAIVGFKFKMREDLKKNVYGADLKLKDFNETQELYMSREYEPALNAVVKTALQETPEPAETSALTSINTRLKTLTVAKVNVGTIDTVDKHLTQITKAMYDTAHGRLQKALKGLDTSMVYSGELSTLVDEELHTATVAMDKDLVALTTSTPPTLSYKTFEDTIRKHVQLALEHANGSYGLSVEAARDKLLTDKLDAKHQDWKDANDTVLKGIDGMFNFKEYGVLPSTANKMALVKLWYESIGNENPAYNRTSFEDERQKYAIYFLSMAKSYFGGEKAPVLNHAIDWDSDWVSNDRFSSQLTQLKNAIHPFQGLTSSQNWDANRDAFNTVATESPDDLYREQELEKFRTWFDAKMNLDRFFSIDGEWPEVFKRSVETRLLSIPDTFTANTTPSLSDEIERFKSFVKVEKNLYDYLIDADVQLNYEHNPSLELPGSVAAALMTTTGRILTPDQERRILNAWPDGTRALGEGDLTSSFGGPSILQFVVDPAFKNNFYFSNNNVGDYAQELTERCHTYLTAWEPNAIPSSFLTSAWSNAKNLVTDV